MINVYKKYKPVTPSMRYRVMINKKILYRGKSINKLSFGISNSGGRNNNGNITVRHVGGLKKKIYRKIDFKRSLAYVPGHVIRIEYDPNRSCYIALICYVNGILTYVIAPQKLKPGDIVISGYNIESKVGNSLPLLNIIIGSIIHNIELKPGAGAKLARSAGTYAILINKGSDGYATVRLCSGEVRRISLFCLATIGAVSNSEHQNIVYGKASSMYYRNRRSSVRGVAMNPVDHPHGGGQGKTSGGRVSVTPWGKYTKGKKTRSNKYTSKFIISRRI